MKIPVQGQSPVGVTGAEWDKPEVDMKPGSHEFIMAQACALPECQHRHDSHFYDQETYRFGCNDCQVCAGYRHDFEMHEREADWINADE